MLPLDRLGKRIVIVGPSNAGKSTLAVALSDRLGIPAVHLDQLHHLPNTDWEKRPRAEFVALHDVAVAADTWIMDGNYSGLMPQRLARATGAILITSGHWRRFFRYIRRTVVNRSNRAGHLEGAKDSLKWEMAEWILQKTRHSADRYAELLNDYDLPVVKCHTAAELNALYRYWGLPSRQ